MAFTLISVEEIHHPGLPCTVVQAVHCTKLPALMGHSSHCIRAATYMRVGQKLWASPLSPGAMEGEASHSQSCARLGRVLLGPCWELPWRFLLLPTAGLEGPYLTLA